MDLIIANFMLEMQNKLLFTIKIFGFEIIAYSGLETGNKNSTSYVLRQNEINLVITSPGLIPK